MNNNQNFNGELNNSNPSSNNANGYMQNLNPNINQDFNPYANHDFNPNMNQGFNENFNYNSYSNMNPNTRANNFQQNQSSSKLPVILAVGLSTVLFIGMSVCGFFMVKSDIASALNQRTDLNKTESRTVDQNSNSSTTNTPTDDPIDDTTILDNSDLGDDSTDDSTTSSNSNVEDIKEHIKYSTFVTDTGATIYFTNGDYVMYPDDTNHLEDYDKGAYSISTGAAAKELITTEHPDKALTENDIRELCLIDSSVPTDNIVYLKFFLLEKYEEGTNTTSLQDNTVQSYAGYYSDGTFTLVSLDDDHTTVMVEK